MKKIIILGILLIPVFSLAQQPKLNLKLLGGLNTNSFIYQIEGVEADVFAGWQVGVGMRVIKRKAFVEFDCTYQNYGTSIVLFEEIAPELDEALELRMKALEFPLTAGYIPVKTPFFKWFLYGGFVNKFTLHGKYTYLDVEETFKPKDFDLHFYNLLARIGTQFDLAMFNFDLNYNIGITNGVKNKARTNTNGVQFSVALLF